MKSGAQRENEKRDRRSGCLAGKQIRGTLTGKKVLQEWTRNMEGIKQDDVERGSSVMVCNKYLAKQHYSLKTGREPEVWILPC